MQLDHNITERNEPDDIVLGAVFASGIKKVLLSPITGLFSVKIRKKFIAIKNFSVNDMMSGQPNKRLIH